MLRSLLPQDRVDERDLERGLTMLVADGICSQSMLTLTQGPILVAFALLLGASNTVVGLVAAIGPLSNILQIPSIFLVERTAHRKAAVVLSCLVSRSFWVLAAFLPWMAPAPWRIPLLLLYLVGHFGIGAIAGCAFNSWVHDLVPPSRLAGFFARRMAWSMGVGAALSLGAGIAMDAWGRADDPFRVFAGLFLLGAVVGYVGCWTLARIPEPRMTPQRLGGVREVIAEPFREAGFRSLLAFVGTWTFAANLAAPFFAVYLIERLGQGMLWVLGLSVLSQVAHAMALKPFGRLAERRGEKAALAVAGPLFLAAIALWPVTGAPGPDALTHVLLVVIHVLAGVATAGVNLCAGNLALKEAPRGKATQFLAGNALVAGVAATAAPLLAGGATDVLEAAGFALPLGPFPLAGLDLVFLAAVVAGLVALWLLVRVREGGHEPEPIDHADLWAEVLRGVLLSSTVAGLRRRFAFPYGRLRGLLGRRERPTATRDDGTRGSSPRRPGAS